MTMSKSARIAVAIVAIVAACSLGIAGTAYAATNTSSAQATATSSNITGTTANVSTINPNAPVTLDIHKLLGQPTGGVNNGTAQNVAGDPLSGVVFDIYEVEDYRLGSNGSSYGPYDLTTNKGWQEANVLKGLSIPASDLPYRLDYDTPSGVEIHLTKVASVTTGSNGVATFNQSNGAKMGVYLVAENLAASKNVTDVTTGKVITNTSEIQSCAPFIVTLPMTNPDNTSSWMYTVNVYPKNQLPLQPPHKAVSQAAASSSAPASAYTVGQKLTYTVSQQVPYYGDVVGAPVNGKYYTAPDGKVDYEDLPYYVVEDTFDRNVSVGADPVAKVTIGNTVLTPYMDYVVGVFGQKVTVTWTTAGLDKIAGSHEKLTTTFDVTVKSVPASGVISNKAYVFPAPQPSPGESMETFNPNATPTSSETSNNVDVKFGRIRITKVSGTDTSKKLADAQFSVYRADGDSCSNIDTSAAPITTMTTDAQGQAVSEPLTLSTWYNDGLEASQSGNNDGALDGAQYAAKHGDIDYCLVETKAPTGYSLLAKPVLYTIKDAGDTATAADWTTIEDAPANFGNHLPLTGGTSVALIVIAGAALVGGSLMVYERNRKKNEAATK